MGIIFIFLGCFLLYAKSQHFPEFLKNTGHKAKQNKTLVRIFSYLIFGLSFTLFVNQFGFATGMIIFFITLTFGLCITILLLQLHRRYIYILTGLTVLIVIIENII